jgi:hypothetical protein
MRNAFRPLSVITIGATDRTLESAGVMPYLAQAILRRGRSVLV